MQQKDLRTASGEPAVLVSKKSFQALHSAARTVYGSMLAMPDPTVEVSLVVHLLDDAISEGHDVLGTDRGFADRYILMAGPVAQRQLQHINQFLAQEGINLPKDGQTEETSP